MKILKIIFFVVFIAIAFEINLFSTITSRIEGVVMDEDTGQPISGVKVSLFNVSANKLQFTIGKFGTTDNQGFFKFDMVGAGYYYLCFFHNGYADIRPRRVIWADDIEGVLDKNEKVDIFKLDEGKVKHIKVKMQKEAILNIKAFIKLPGMSEPVPTEAEITVNEIVNSEIASTFSSKNDVKEITLYRMRAGSYKISIFVGGFNQTQDESIVLEKGKTKNFTFVADFTTGQTLHGWVKYYFNNELYVLPHASISILKKDESEYVGVNANENGEYWLGGFSPGEYTLSINSFSISYAKRVVDINQTIYFNINEKKEMNHEIR